MGLEMATATAIALDSLPERQCRVCREWKAAHAFTRRAGSRTGLRTLCAACNRTEVARYHAAKWGDSAYRDKRRKECARYYAKNPEYFARYRTAHRDEIRERAARYHRENPEVSRAAERRRRARKRDNGVIPYREADVWGAYNHACIACGLPGEHVDHWTAIANGGPDAIANTCILCEACNLSKGARDPLEFLASRGIRFDRVVYVDE